MPQKSWTDIIREAQAADRRKHPYRGIYQNAKRDGLTDKQREEVNETVIILLIGVIVVGVLLGVLLHQ
jgi:hypothetical protein